jgi:hypothetical protein
MYRSCTDLAWLRAQRKNENKAWAYFFSFMLFIILIQMLALLVTVPRSARQMWHRVQGNIPHFSAMVEEGRLSIDGLEQPFIFESEENGERFRMVIDTQSDVGISEEEVFDNTLDTGILITEGHMAFYDAESGHMQTQAFPQDAHWQFDRDDFVTFGDRFVGNILPFLIPLAIFFVFLFWSAAKLIYLLFVSLLVWLAGMFGNRSWEFTEVYIVGLYAITLPTLVNLLLAWLAVPFPFLYTIILFALLLAVLFGEEKKKTTPKPQKKQKKARTQKK